MEYTSITDMRFGRGRALIAISILALGLTLPLASVDTAMAQNAVRSWGMGGAGVATARGLEAVDFNPANLAFSSGFSLGLASAAVDVRNNAIGLERYNEITGAHLDHADKERLLGDIPAEGFKLDADMRASALGLQLGNFAMTVGAVGAGSGNLDKDYFDLVLFGNQMGETVDFSGTDGEGYAVGQAAFSYGGVLHENEAMSLGYGLSAKYLHGIYEMHVQDAYGSMSTSREEINGEAFVSTLSSQGGAGWGVDLGLALQMGNGWSLGASVENLYATMQWDNNVEAREFRVSAREINALNGDRDNSIVDSDTTLTADAYSSNLPAKLRLGAANRFGPLMVALDYTQGFEDRGTASTTPRFHLGGELWSDGLVQPRFGLSAGGVAGTGASAGLGLRLGVWKVDMAVLSRGELDPNKTKGLAFAAGSSLVF
ncbi:hypothetical protein CSA17_02355 [bacterium DOLJORAL78_65_58]|nr:MAG: hypothetical protein CSB20_00355 [bacterium DOLZORAL124_64_63]PIE76411.1 MAG: hypothetical protein CSA17_02355 [bacterium DOLJORAL78_65_58]